MWMKNKWPLLEGEQGAEQPGSTAGGGEPSDAGLATNWDSLDREYDALDTATDEPPAAPSEPSAPAAAVPVEVPPSEPAPAAAPAQPPEAVVPPVQPAAVEPPVQPAQPAQPAAPVAPAPSREQLRAQYGEQLATQYALSEDDARAMLTEPERVIPKLAAQLHMDVVDTVINAVFSRLPAIVHGVQQSSVANRTAEESFFKAWPQLQDKKYQGVVWNAVANYRSLNPQAKMEEVVRAAGLSAMLHLRLPLPAELMQFEQPAVQPKAFTPAAPGAATIPTGPSGPQNPFVALSEELLADDRGG